MKVKNNWYSIVAKEGRAEVMIYDEIGLWGVNAKDFVEEINSLDVSAIDLRLNTPGGSVFDGNAIYNAIKRHPAEVTVHIDGLAASMGSVIALAGDHVKMAANALFMIHNPWTIALGDADELRETAGILDKLRDGIVGTYAAKANLEADALTAAMDAETWFTAEEALAAGFVDEITNAKEAKASATFKAALARFKNTPDLPEAVEEPKATTIGNLTVKINVDTSDLDAVLAKLAVPEAEDAKHQNALAAYQRRQQLNEWAAL